MPTQEQNHSQYSTAIENTSGYEAIATPTLQNPYVGEIISMRKKVVGTLLNNIKFGVDRKATHLWNK